MKTITVQLFEFKELQKKIQEKILEKHRNVNVDYNEWYDCTYENWKEKLKEMGFENPVISFSGFWSQGDGACFDCTEFGLEKLATKLEYNPVEAELLKIMEPEICIESYDNHYCHAKTRHVNVQWRSCCWTIARKIAKANPNELPLFISDEMPEEDRELLETRLKHPKAGVSDPDDLQKKFEEALEELRIDLCQDIYKTLETEYDFLISDEAVQETIEANEWEFTASGRKEIEFCTA